MEKNNQVVIFELNNQNYAIPIHETSEIIKMAPVTVLPNTSFHIQGIINLRGSVIPVINLNRRLELPEKELDESSRIIVVNTDSGKRAGLIVERVSQIGNYDPGEVEQPDGSSGEVNFIKGIIKKDEAIWLLLDINKLIR